MASETTPLEVPADAAADAARGADCNALPAEPGVDPPAR